MPEQNEPLGWLENVKLRAKQLRAEEAEVKKQIRDGLLNAQSFLWIS